MGQFIFSTYLISFIIFFFLISSALVVFTEEADNSIKHITLDAIVVTAERPKSTFQTGDVDIDRTSAFYSVIPHEDFEGKMEDLSEVIEKEAGVQVRQSGGLGSFSSISLRGSASDQVMVFLDGILLNEASGGGVDLSAISLADIEAVEIFRGVTPIHFSKASIGGAVNIRTLRSKKGFKASVSTGYGSFNSRKTTGFFNHKPGKGDYLICADYLGSDNDFAFLNNKLEYNDEDDSWERRNNAQIEQENILAKFGFDFTHNFRVDLAHHWFSKHQGLPGWDNDEKTKTFFDTKRNITTLKLTADNIGPYRLNTSTGFNYARKGEEYNDRQGHIGLDSQHSKYITVRSGGYFFLEWLNKINTASFRLDIQREEYNPEDLLKKKNPYKSTRDTVSLGLQDRLGLFQHSLNFTPTLRYTFIKDELKKAVSKVGVPLEEKSKKKDYLSPHLGLKYIPNIWFTLKANLSRYVREPSFFELFGDRGFSLGNEDLKEEKGVNFDIGFEINYSTPNEILKRFSCQTAYFKREVDDLITRIYDARGVGKAVNISQSKIQGIEASINLHFLKNIRLIGNAARQEPKNLSQIPASYGKRLPGIPENSFLGRIEVIFGMLKLYGEWVVEEGMYYSEDNKHRAKNKRETNAGISLLVRSVLLTFEAKNLGDDQYEDFNGYPLPGRSFYSELKINF